MWNFFRTELISVGRYGSQVGPIFIKSQKQEMLVSLDCRKTSKWPIGSIKYVSLLSLCASRPPGPSSLHDRIYFYYMITTDPTLLPSSLLIFFFVKLVPRSSCRLCWRFGASWSLSKVRAYFSLSKRFISHLPCKDWSLLSEAWSPLDFSWELSKDLCSPALFSICQDFTHVRNFLYGMFHTFH